MHFPVSHDRFLINSNCGLDSRIVEISDKPKFLELLSTLSFTKSELARFFQFVRFFRRTGLMTDVSNELK